MEKTSNYTCKDYREEMLLLGLRKRLEDQALSDAERASLRQEIERLEAGMKMD